MSYDYDGVDDSINHGSAASLDDLGPVSVSIWINPDTFPDFSIPLGKATGGLSWYLYLDTGGIILTWIEHVGGAPSANTTGTLTAGVWRHIAMTWDGVATTAPRVYHNGVDETTNAAPGSGARVSDATVDLRTGSDSAGASSLIDGKQARAKVWNVELSATEMLADFRGFRVRPANLVLWARYEQDANDISGSGNNGTVAGATLLATNHPYMPYRRRMLGGVGGY